MEHDVLQLSGYRQHSVEKMKRRAWDTPHETAYPSTFILDVQGKILFEKISHSHGDRTTAADVLAQLVTK